MIILPNWDELPSIQLYNDQLIEYVTTHLSHNIAYPIHITRSMINNYIKLGLLSTPNKKKFTQKHIAELILISFFKISFTLSEIKQVMTLYSDDIYGLYTQFITQLNYLNNSDKPVLSDNQITNMILSVLYKIKSLECKEVLINER